MCIAALRPSLSPAILESGRRISEGPAHSWKKPGPSALARHEARVRPVFMRAIRGVVQCGVRGAWRRARTRIGYTVAGAARSRYASVGVAITVTNTAPENARGFVGARRCGARVNATNGA